MKFYISIFIFITIWLSTVSCKTIKKPKLEAQNTDSEEVIADVINEDSAANDLSEQSTLESEFSNSEDFEKQVTDELFTKEDNTENTLEDNLEDTVENNAEDTAENNTEQDFTEEKQSPSQSASTLQVATKEEPLSENNLSDGDITEQDTIQEDTADKESSIVVNNIRYKATENKIYIDATGTISYQSRENIANNQFVIEISQAVLSKSLQERPFIMKDFNTQVVLLQADQKNNKTVRIVMQMKKNANMPSVLVSDTGSLVISPNTNSYDSESSIVANSPANINPSEEGSFSNEEGNEYGTQSKVLPAKSLAEFFLSSPHFTGRPISIHLRDVSVRDVLYFISEGTGLNMVLSEDVKGKISIKLRDVPWDQALVTVMKTKKLGYLREGNVIRIMSLASLKKDQSLIKQIVEEQKVLDPLKIKVIPVIYTKVIDMQEQAKIFLTKDRGKLIIDEQSNSLIVTDTTRVIRRIEVMVKHLDKVPKQIMIEAKVVETTEDVGNILGITWGFTGAPLNITPGGNPQLALNVAGNLIGFPALRTNNSVVSGRTLSGGFNIGFAPVGSLDISLGLSESEGIANIVSAPRIMVLNGETAKITQSYESISVSTQQSNDTGASLGTSAQRDEAKLEFEVSPKITAIGSVFLDINLRREFFGAEAEPRTGAHPKNSRETKTKVLVQNGQTVVIGGIYHHAKSRSDEGIPILKYIPILKMFFSRTTKSDSRVELLLFLTPRIINIASTNSVSTIH